MLSVDDVYITSEKIIPTKCYSLSRDGLCFIS